jgi:hypothetical protein
MTDEIERIPRQAVVLYSRYYPSISLEELRKTTLNLSIAESGTQPLQNISLECYL